MLISLIFSFLYLAPKALLIGAAILPAAVLLVYVYRHDRIEKEPRKLLLTLVLLGIVATFLAVATESLGAIALAWFLPGGEDNPAYPIWMYFVVVALSEEGFKYLILRWRTWRSPEFNCRFDAVVYAVFVSLGFALWENIGYVMMYGVGAALARAITAVPGHACFGVFMGAYYGLAKRSANRGETAVSRFWRILALLVPTEIHGLYDYIAVNETESFSTTFVVFVLVVFVLAFVLAWPSCWSSSFRNAMSISAEHARTAKQQPAAGRRGLLWLFLLRTRRVLRESRHRPRRGSESLAGQFPNSKKSKMGI